EQNWADRGRPPIPTAGPELTLRTHQLIEPIHIFRAASVEKTIKAALRLRRIWRSGAPTPSSRGRKAQPKSLRVQPFVSPGTYIYPHQVREFARPPERDFVKQLRNPVLCRTEVSFICLTGTFIIHLVGIRQRKIIRKQRFTGLRVGVNHLADAMLAESLIEFRAVNLSIDQVGRQCSNIGWFERVLSPKHYSSSVCVEIPGSFRNKLGEYFSHATQSFRFINLVALRVICKPNVVRFVCG